MSLTRRRDLRLSHTRRRATPTDARSRAAKPELPDVLELQAWRHLAIVKESHAVDLAAVAALNRAPQR